MRYAGYLAEGDPKEVQSREPLHNLLGEVGRLTDDQLVVLIDQAWEDRKASRLPPGDGLVVVEGGRTSGERWQERITGRLARNDQLQATSIMRVLRAEVFDGSYEQPSGAMTAPRNPERKVRTLWPSVSNIRPRWLDASSVT